MLPDGKSLLQQALLSGHAAVIIDLLNKEAPVSRSALLWFAQSNSSMHSQMELFSRIFNAVGGSIDEVMSGKTLVQWAAETRKQALLQHLIVEHKASIALADVIRPSWGILPRSFFDMLMSHNVDPWAADASGSDGSRGNVLAAVLRSGFLAGTGTSSYQRDATYIVERLLAEWGGGADAFAKTLEAAALVVEAARLPHWPTVSRLIQAQASVESVSADGETALHLAVAKSNLEVVQQLLWARANAQAMRDDCATPLRIAEDASWEAGCALLREACQCGAQPEDASVEN